MPLTIDALNSDGPGALEGVVELAIAVVVGPVAGLFGWFAET
jgi:hypothetical protein